VSSRRQDAAVRSCVHGCAAAAGKANGGLSRGNIVIYYAHVQCGEGENGVYCDSARGSHLHSPSVCFLQNCSNRAHLLDAVRLCAAVAAIRVAAASVRASIARFLHE
jgi:hypothetical protein